MFNWLSSLVMHPGLLAGGALLVSLPLLIHLLNKRKFKIIDWAAMDFLFDADKRNRRRVRLEDLLILLLRMAAVVLAAFLLARPFLSSQALGGFTAQAGFERIVVLDDSPSMQSRQNDATSFEGGKRVVAEMARGLASRGTGDTLTLVITSHPNEPVINESAITPETLDRILTQISTLKPSGRAARYDESLRAIEKHLNTRTSNLNRILYLVGDVRQQDWPMPSVADRPAGPAMLLRAVSEKTSGCYIVDVGANDVANLAITDVTTQEKVLAAGLSCRFEVTVHNFGPTDATNVGLRLSPEGSLPVEGKLARVGAGQSAALPITFTFARGGPIDSDGPPAPVRLRVELELPADATQDVLAIDNVRYYPARIVGGIRTLVVDGDPTTEAHRGESYYLRRALSPRGNMVSGVSPDVVTAAEFETLDLAPYQVIYLANVDRVTESRQAALEEWVRRGGGLVIALGDQLFDVAGFNDRLYRGGQGLSPIEVAEIRGDERESQWSLFSVVERGHEVAGLYEGQNNPFIEGVKVFRWWHSRVSEKELRSGQVRLLVRLTDADASPAIVERSFGLGRVVAVTTPLDADWNTWPDDPSYLLTMQYLTRYLARSTSRMGMIDVGQPLKVPLDLVKYKLDVTLSRPHGERVGLQPIQSVKKGGSSDSTWLVTSADTEEPGFYSIGLSRNDGAAEEMLFAANLDPRESDLARMDPVALAGQLGDSKVRIVSGQQLLELGTDETKEELWLAALTALGLVLCSEQLLAWLFGRRR